MGEWRNYHIYYTDVDRLITECVYPLLSRRDDSLETCFFERHYAGGAHLRVRLRGEAGAVEDAGAELVREAERFIAAHPSEPVENYSPQFAAKLLELEDEPAEPDDLVYRVNEVRSRPYQRLQHRLASDEAASLLADFLHDCMPLAVDIIRAERPKQEQLLRLYFLEARSATGDVRHGCVSFKSHWEGLAMNFSSPALNERIKANYAQQRELIRGLLLEVMAHCDQDTLDSDPVLGPWHELLTRYERRAQAILAQGTHLTFQYSTVDNVRQAREYVEAHMWEESPFLRTLYQDERFMASIQHETDFLLPRVLTNLLYSLLALVGLGMIDKMALCFYAHRIVEDHYGCDLTEILRQTARRIVDKNKHRFAES